MKDLRSAVSSLHRIGKTTAHRLKKLGIETVEDLIFYFPYRWEDLRMISSIDSIQMGTTVTIKAKIQLISSRRLYSRKKTISEALVADESGSLKIIWFNQPYVVKSLAVGDEVVFSGKVTSDNYALQLVNPVYEKVSDETTHTGRIVPMYSLTSSITQKQLRFLIKEALYLTSSVQEWLPGPILKKYQLMGLQMALRNIHFPTDFDTLEQARKRLAFDELFMFELQVLSGRKEMDASPAQPLLFKESETKQFVSSLPFSLTEDQRKASWQVLKDMERDRPMSRLMEGDVGSGKTTVAAIAALNCALNGHQAVVMAPTEILALQHYHKMWQSFNDFGVTVALLTRSQLYCNGRKITKKELLPLIAANTVSVIFGTHALISEKVIFASLALAIIDEQHRFGVKQRKLLTEKNSADFVPHLLSMTATPIPRTLSLALYGDLDISLIRSMPAERKKIITRVVDPGSRQKAYEFVRQQIHAGRQVFVVCPLIDPSDVLGVASVNEEFSRLSKDVFPGLRLAMLHGKMKAAEKEETMNAFTSGAYDVLVATSVIEVGVDVPNASVVLIEGAERFGLAQLHQIRGRVGRSIHQSYCLLFCTSMNERVQLRMDAMVKAPDGFALAEYDLQMRGPGDTYGVNQSGWPSFKIARLSDIPIIQQAKAAVADVLEHDDQQTIDFLKQKTSHKADNLHLE